MSFITREVEIYDNERYQLTAFDFSAKGLLPTDRSAFSNRSGQVGASTVEKLEDMLSSRGWEWLEGSEWVVDKEAGRTDADGWSYSSSFGAIEESSSPTKAMTHFVRRRKRTRTQVFAGSHYYENATCDHCDFEELERLSDKLLSVVAECSLLSYPDYMQEACVNDIKSRLMMHLEIGSRDSPSIDYQIATNRLDCFVTYFQEGMRSAWTVLSPSVPPKDMSKYSDPNSPYSLRCAEIAQFWFAPRERKEVALMLIRHHDLKNQFHCSVQRCGAECEFIRISCPNEGCPKELSRIRLQRHDDVCEYKCVPCTRTCGDVVQRRLMQVHLSDSCELLPVQCTFVEFGCHCDLVVRTLPKHLAEHVQDHLDLSMKRIMEQQTVIISLNKRITTLENSVDSQTRRMEAYETATSASIAAMVVAEKAQRVAYMDNFHGIEKKFNGNVGEINNNMSRIANQVNGLEQRVAVLSKAVPIPSG